MDIRVFDRAQDAYLLAKRNQERLHDPGLKQKVMVFVLPGRVRTGADKTELRFPYPGKIVGLYASCSIAGVTRTGIALEKCSQQNYESTPQWENILSANLFLDQNGKSSNTASVPYKIKWEDVKANDHFRVNVIEAGEGAQNVTVEMIVEI